MFGPGTAGKRPVGDASIAGSECEPWSSCLLSRCCKTMQPDKQEGERERRIMVKQRASLWGRVLCSQTANLVCHRVSLAV